MTREELEQAIRHTLEEIVLAKQELGTATKTEEKRLKRKIKELQYLQLWHLDLLKRTK